MVVAHCFWQEAIEKYDGVVQNLEFAKDLQKQFLTIQAEVKYKATAIIFAIVVIIMSVVAITLEAH